MLLELLNHILYSDFRLINIYIIGQNYMEAIIIKITICNIMLCPYLWMLSRILLI